MPDHVDKIVEQTFLHEIDHANINLYVERSILQSVFLY